MECQRKVTGTASQSPARSITMMWDKEIRLWHLSKHVALCPQAQAPTLRLRRCPWAQGGLAAWSVDTSQRPSLLGEGHNWVSLGMTEGFRHQRSAPSKLFYITASSLPTNESAQACTSASAISARGLCLILNTTLLLMALCEWCFHRSFCYN